MTNVDKDFAMALYIPLEIMQNGKGTGLWHYVCVEGSADVNRTFAVGYCAKDCPGHASKQEAVDHFDAYLIDNSVSWENPDQMLKCVADGCGAFTMGRMRHGIASPFTVDYALCEKHCTKDGLKKHLDAERERRRQELNGKHGKYKGYEDWVREAPSRRR